MRYNPEKHRRRSIRLKEYDYSQAGLYFITICCQDRAHLFGSIENKELHLNEFGKIAATEWANTENIRNNVRIHEYIIMPNHIHGIIEILFKKLSESESTSGNKFHSPSHTIGAIIRGFKIATIKKIKDFIQESDSPIRAGESQFAPTIPGESQFPIRTGESQFAPTEKIKSLNFKIWQRNYYEHIIRDNRAYENISNYIINNPKKWKEDKFYKK